MAVELSDSRLSGVVPHWKSKGTDIVGDYQTYVIRSDLGCYMKLNEYRGADVVIRPLHKSLQWADHYLAYLHAPMLRKVTRRTYFYAIKGKYYVEVSDLSTVEDREEGVLHEKCQGGDFYMATSTYRPFTAPPTYIIVFLEKGTFRAVSDLKTAEPSTHLSYDGRDEYELHPNCRDGLYYWAVNAFWKNCVWYWIIKGVGPWGVQFHHTTDLCTDAEGGSTECFLPSVTNFLPGGLAVTRGPAFGVWEKIKAIENTHGTVELNWDSEISRKVGYRRELCRSFQQTWRVDSGLDFEKIFKTAFQRQLSLSPAYGGLMADTARENWSEEREVQEHLNVTIPPGRSLYIWQYKIGMKREGEPSHYVLYTGHLKQTDTPDLVTPSPLPDPPSPLDFSQSEEEPQIRQLRFMKSASHDVTVHIIQEVQAKWTKLADFLDFPLSTVDNLRAECGFSPERACRSVFVRWLNGEGCGPRTWGTLVEIFRNMGLRTLADNVILVLKDC